MFTSWRRSVLFLGLIVLMPACAGAAGTSSETTRPSGPEPSRPSPGTVTVRPQDAGRTVTLYVGDTLVFSVSGASPSPAGAGWHLLSYPRNLISLISRSPTPPFRFRALESGMGELRLTLGSACGSPGPLPASYQFCPVGESPSGGGPPGLPIRLFTFPLKLLPRGR